MFYHMRRYSIIVNSHLPSPRLRFSPSRLMNLKLSLISPAPSSGTFRTQPVKMHGKATSVFLRLCSFAMPSSPIAVELTESNRYIFNSSLMIVSLSDSGNSALEKNDTPCVLPTLSHFPKMTSVSYFISQRSFMVSAASRINPFMVFPGTKGSPYSSLTTN